MHSRLFKLNLNGIKIRLDECKIWYKKIKIKSFSPAQCKIPKFLSRPRQLRLFSYFQTRSISAEMISPPHIIYNGAPLPQDRESLFWINVKSIPSSSREDINKLQIAVNTRIKLFYRPSNLMDEPTDISKNVQWSVKNNELIVRNNSSYYISFAEVKINNKAWSEIDMLAPKSSTTFTLRNTLLKNNATVQWKYINDYGGNSQLITQKIE